MTEKEVEVRIRDDEHRAIDLVIFDDGSSRLQNTECFKGGQITFFHLNKVATLNLYRVLWKYFGILKNELDDLKELAKECSLGEKQP